MAGTATTVVISTVSLATVRPVWYRLAATKTFCAVGRAEVTTTAKSAWSSSCRAKRAKT